MPDLLTFASSDPVAVKAGGDTLVLAGWLVRFTDAEHPDPHGDFFTKATDFGPLSDTGSAVVASYFDHGQDPALGRERLGTATLTLKDEGVWAEHQITRRKSYLARLAARAAEEGDGLGQSSGTAAHLMGRSPVGKARHITAWPIAEASITPTPAEAATTAAVKALRLPEDGAAKTAPYGDAFEERIRRVQQAVNALYPYDYRLGEPRTRAYVLETYDAHAVVEVYTTGNRDESAVYKVPYTTSDEGAAVLAPSSDWTRVKRAVSYEEATAKALLDTFSADEDARALLAVFAD